MITNNEGDEVMLDSVFEASSEHGRQNPKIKRAYGSPTKENCSKKALIILEPKVDLQRLYM